MVFRKDALLYTEGQALGVVMALASVMMIIMAGWSFVIILGFPVFLLIMNPLLHNEFMKIDESGISCQKSGKEIWRYRWDEIAELRRGSRFRLPSVEIIAYGRNGTPEQFAAPGHYFQRSKAARAAVNKYYKAKCDE